MRKNNKIRAFKICKRLGNLNKNNKQKRQSVSSILRFFLDNTSIHGCKRISNKKISSYERAFWIMFGLLTIIMTGLLLQHLYDDYMDHPTLITADPTEIPITNIKFPGVAICSVNKISKKRAHSFAEYLYRQDAEVRHVFKDKSKLLEAIKLLANLYDFNGGDKIAEETFQTILEHYDNLTKSYDPTDRLIDLAPTCKEILLNCKWGGVEYNCDELFATRATFDGNCCVFNYVRPISRRSLFNKLNNRDNIPSEARKSLGAGIRNGLQLVLKDYFDDYFVTTTEIRGHVISIFNPLDFPDKSSGSLTEIPADSGVEVFVSLRVSIVKPTNAIRIVSPTMRHCIFNDERHTDFGGYRHSDCLAACKTLAMKYLCQCITFCQPLEDLSYCTLADLNCLSNFRSKWTNYYPVDEDTPVLNFERENSINCRHCISACKDEIYTTSVEVSPIAIKPTNNTYVNIYFERPFGNAFTIDVTQTWYDLVSNFGGLISLVMGLSFISFTELLVLLYKLAYHSCYEYNKTREFFE